MNLTKHLPKFLLLATLIIIISYVHTAFLILVFAHSFYSFLSMIKEGLKIPMRFFFFLLFGLESLAFVIGIGIPILANYWQYIFFGTACALQACYMKISQYHRSTSTTEVTEDRLSLTNVFKN